jgi:hypothetical protein
MNDWKKINKQKRLCEEAIEKGDLETAKACIRKLELLIDYDSLDFDDKVRVAYEYMILWDRVSR